jgi:hypothetical protein
MSKAGSQLTFLAAAEAVLRASRRPLSSKELVADATALRLLKTRGLAPHKTMNARLSEDIKQNPTTKFMRSYHGQFALREWSEVREFETRPRKINPMDENILVVPLEDFRALLSRPDSNNPPFFQIPLNELLQKSVVRKRQLVEEDSSFVQIISLFS